MGASEGCDLHCNLVLKIQPYPRSQSEKGCLDDGSVRGLRSTLQLGSEDSAISRRQRQGDCGRCENFACPFVRLLDAGCQLPRQVRAAFESKLKLLGTIFGRPTSAASGAFSLFCSCLLEALMNAELLHPQLHELNAML
eukprot:s6171_g2.t1